MPVERNSRNRSREVINSAGIGGTFVLRRAAIASWACVKAPTTILYITLKYEATSAPLNMLSLKSWAMLNSHLTAQSRRIGAIPNKISTFSIRKVLACASKALAVSGNVFGIKSGPVALIPISLDTSSYQNPIPMNRNRNRLAVYAINSEKRGNR